MHHCLTRRFIFNLVAFCCSLYWYASAQLSDKTFMISDNNSATQIETQSTTSLTTSNRTIIDTFPTLPLPEKHFKIVYSPLPNYTEYAAGPMIIPITIGNITIKSPLYQLFSTVVLVKDNEDNSCNILVDTGIAIDRNIIISNLAIHGIQPNNIHYVILTHGHPDHTGNQNLFTQAKVLFGRLGMQGHTFIEYRDGVFQNGPGEYVRLCKYCKLYPTPGHTASDLTLVVENVHGYGTVAIAGDLFISETDFGANAIWSRFSTFPQAQQESRRTILCISDVIFPGHGRPFKVDNEIRRKAGCNVA